MGKIMTWMWGKVGFQPKVVLDDSNAASMLVAHHAESVLNGADISTTTHLTPDHTVLITMYTVLGHARLELGSVGYSWVFHHTLHGDSLMYDTMVSGSIEYLRTETREALGTLVKLLGGVL